MDLFEKVKEAVSIYDLFDRASPPVRYETREAPCKIRCPFHGTDNRKSAQVYPESDSFWCFTCSRGWDVLDFWAEANEWWKEKDGAPVRDVARAARDLAEEYGVENERTDWEKRFYAIRDKANHTTNYSEYPLDQRERLRDYYSWRIGNLVASTSGSTEWEEVRNTWDEFLLIDLSEEGWKRNLTNWFESAKIRLYG